MNEKKVAEQILKAVGGDKNVSHLEHCSTRLRFTLVNDDQVNVEELKQIPEVLGVNQTAQCQVIIGNSVVEVYNELKKMLTQKDPSADNKKDKKLGTVLLDFVISIFQPLIPAIAGGGILKSVLMLLNMLGVLESTTQTYQILNFVGDAPLYFLPLLVAITTANKLKVNSLVAVSAVGGLLIPGLAAMLGEGAALFSFQLQNVNYTYQVFPAILCILCYAQLEKFFTKISPKVIRTFFVPMMSLLIVVPLTLLVLGPLGYNFGQGFASIIIAIFERFGWIAVAILAAFLPFMVVTGMHKAMLPYVITSLGQSGSELIYCSASLAHNIAEAGGCFAVALRTKDKGLKATAISSGISALFGITEPALYGVTILHKRALYGVMIGSFIGGAYLGITAVEAYVAVGPGLASLSMFISETLPNNLMNAVIGLVISFVASFAAVAVIWKESTVEEAVKDPAEELACDEILTAPLEGQVIPISEVKDEVFSNKLLGDGFAIIPTKGEVYAPADGVIEMIYDTKHSLGLKTASGVEILFHIGIDTVNLKGEHFEPMVEVKQQVKQGDLLLKFDLEKIVAAGFDPVSVVVITNPKKVQLNFSNTDQVKKMDSVLTLSEGVGV
ncbi:PTS glucose transporter subunit IIA [Enterococcus sp. 669A]|uniref:PTS glucose transporter subunit IIA n=1 Tax=Candidatus Enterococcus moelleringii TaxID=2815325 RepID=A0ABS3L9K3_9ENTE|nr:beta-glucoside-specific PTS transporter subunit IIABC [Enterococcus sp. 669A]MBO1306291.1 PTS glucose transporter subunit IIA [Enterococcus sp. 669A]